jgi:hypothetical protein
MNSTQAEIGVYGFVNGLGFRGDQETKARLLRSAQRAANRGDFDTLLGMGVAYIIGAALGSSVRPANPSQGAPVRWG